MPFPFLCCKEVVTSKVLYISVSFGMLAYESRDLSKVATKITIIESHKMKTIFPQNDDFFQAHPFCFNLFSLQQQLFLSPLEITYVIFGPAKKN